MTYFNKYLDNFRILFLNTQREYDIIHIAITNDNNNSINININLIRRSS